MPLGIISTLFETPVSCCIATANMYESRLWPEEEKCLTGAVEKRRREFAAGRAAARRAMEHIGIPAGPLLTNPDRTPRWPPGIVGSISHCDKVCAAVVARSTQIMSLGLDLEAADPIPDEILGLICDSDEIALLTTLKSLERCDWGKVAFCAKEAFYKCYYSITKTFLDFYDVSIHFSQPEECRRGNFLVTLKHSDKPTLPQESRLTGRWALAEGVVLAGVTLKNANPSVGFSV